MVPAVELTRELRLCRTKVWFENIPTARTVRGLQTRTETVSDQSPQHLELTVAPSLMVTNGGKAGPSKEIEKLVREKTVNLNIGNREGC